MTDPKPGDVLVFKAGDDWIGKSIAWLTESDVSHAAIMLDGGRMAEMGPSGISAGTAEAREGDDVILLRLSPEKDSAPLIAAANKYIEDGTSYDFPVLVFLAGLIIYKKIRPTPKFAAITDIILRAACVAADKLIAAAMKKPGHTMVCSQLVYQIYLDCGKEYRIEIENGLLRNANDSAGSDEGIRLADLAADAPELDMVFSAAEDFPSDEELARELCAALEESEESNDFVAADLGSLPSWAKRFMERLEEFLEKSQSNIPLNAMFIAPSDLAYHTKNLKTIDRIDIVRGKR